MRRVLLGGAGIGSIGRSDNGSSVRFRHLLTCRHAIGKTSMRKNHEPPEAVARKGWRYHHLGIPTTDSRPGERHLTHLGIHVCGFETSPYGIEWIRFDPECSASELIRTVPHVAFEVDNLEAALEGQTIIYGIGSPSPGVRTAMIVDDGAPVELLEFSQAG
jgi:hypothetical protein